MPHTNESEPTEQQQAENLSPAGRPRYRSKPFSPRTRVFLLIFGDIICFILFAWLGSTQHGTSAGFDLPYYLWVALPFMLGWFIVAPLLGAFKADLAIQPRQMLIRTSLIWLAAWPVAMLMRWLFVEHWNAQAIPLSSFLSFALVVFAVNLAMLLFWRWPFAMNNQLRQRGL